jgi:hypothetical protein
MQQSKVPPVNEKTLCSALEKNTMREDYRMSYFYRHTQAGLLLPWMTIPAALGLFFADIVVGQGFLFLLPALALGTISWAFSSLTVEVSNDELVWYFGPGVWRKSISRSEIECATAARRKWWWGWGIHLTPRGWLYTVSGLGV